MVIPSPADRDLGRGSSSVSMAPEGVSPRAASRGGSPANYRPEDGDTAHRLAGYSDSLFAVIVTIMVLQLKAPEEPAFSALWPLWRTVISYAVSYMFIAIIWINHHYL